MTTETAAEIGRKRLVDSSELKKKYIHIYKKHFCPLPHEWVQAAPSCRGQGRGPPGQRLFSRRHQPSSPHIPCLQFQCRGPGGRPLWEGMRLPQASTPPWIGPQVWRASSNSLGPPPTPTLRYTVHAGTASAEKLEGWARLVRCWLSLMIAVPGGGPPRADVSEAAESWPGLLQPPTPTVFFFFLKERKKVGDARGAGDRTWGRNKGGQLGRGAPGLSLAALGWG